MYVHIKDKALDLHQWLLNKTALSHYDYYLALVEKAVFLVGEDTRKYHIGKHHSLKDV